MARDSYHAGLPVALDTNRLINKLEVVAITPENVTNPTLRDRAAGTPGRRYYDIGISVAGLGAYEQMIVGRVILYDRLYYHHKVRAAEAMVRKLIEVAEQERGRQFALEELFFNLEDDGMIDLFAGRLRADAFEGGKERGTLPRGRNPRASSITAPTPSRSGSSPGSRGWTRRGRSRTGSIAGTSCSRTSPPPRRAASWRGRSSGWPGSSCSSSRAS